MAMFNRDEEASRSTETIIGPSVKVEGNFVGSGNVVVEGTVNGSLKTQKDLRVGSGAKIKAEVEAANATVAGEIHGNIKISGRLELVASGKIIGNAEAAVLVVAEGGILNGKVMMLKADAPASPPAFEKEKQEKKRTA